jgi:hypothetical protein
VNRVAGQLLALGKPLQPLATDIAAIAQSFDNAGGIEDVMRFIYYYAGTVNGEDALGHYIRSQVVINGEQRTSTPNNGASATFGCTTGTSGCGQALAASRDASRASAARAATAGALLHYLIGP